ncbi:facilitated trehalose transporter Tret1-like [Leguminivora glycinivorella]|uniref:facilitated trehalose transporter Tret1-like n=1 Tax=Leguminivora glycinivorella TaxID=1035111 RepID=UPI00200F376B|nr:facilitated trehalose transporter Tret1-like [Leguminivora glycinivorella]
MAKSGRKLANLISILPMLVGWFSILLATSVTGLLLARFLQGVSMGMIATLGPVLIGEYTSPKNRGAFLMTLSLAIAIGVLTVHTVGSYFGWQTAALLCAFISFINLLIVINCPESPSWLADQGRYDECKRVFRWLRGDDEEEELHSMIDTSLVIRESKEDGEAKDSFTWKVKSGLVYLNETVRKRQFYKPIFIMMHLYTLGQWGGANVMSAYTTKILENVVGPNAIFGLIIISLGTQRIISNSSAVYVIKKIRRRTMLLTTTLINISAYLTIAGYTYAKINGYLPFDHPLIGIILCHIHMFSIATGTVPLPLIIAGELFPLEYRSLAGGISVLFVSINLFLTVKTLPYLFATIGLPGAYCIYAGVVAYCLVVCWMVLPETKDRTLQDIEEEFMGRPLSPEELMSTLSLTSLKHNTDRRCSAPMI